MGVLMSELYDKKQELADWSHDMKRDWDERARHDAKWFIYPRDFLLSDEQFDETGACEVKRLLCDDLDLLANGRDPSTLSLLELGCGIGRMTKHLAQIFGNVQAVDVSGEMIRQARERLADSSHVQFYETNGIDLSGLADESVDLVFSAFVLQHVPSAEVIASLLRDAYRVLRVGGAIKFQTNSLITFDFEEMEKDTWMGASFPEAMIRSFAEEVGAQLICMDGAGSQYCWTIMRKRAPEASPRYVNGPLQVVFHGRSDDPDEKQVPTSGEHASLTLLATGLNLGAADCNSVTVDISGLAIAPVYVGPPRGLFADVAPGQRQNGKGDLARIDVHLPAGAPSGMAEVRIRVASGETSPPVKVEFIPPPPVIPRIRKVINGAETTEGMTRCCPKSLVRVHAEGLDETADTGNIRLQIGERIIKPTYVGALAGNQLHRIEAQLPSDISPGPTELRLYFGNLASPAERIEVTGAEQ